MEKKTEGLEEEACASEEISEQISENSEEDPKAELLDQISALKDTLLRKTA